MVGGIEDHFYALCFAVTISSQLFWMEKLIHLNVGNESLGMTEGKSLRFVSSVRLLWISRLVWKWSPNTLNFYHFSSKLGFTIVKDLGNLKSLLIFLGTGSVQIGMLLFACELLRSQQDLLLLKVLRVFFAGQLRTA